MEVQYPPHSFAERFVRLNLLGRLWGSAQTFVGFASSFITLTALSLHEFGLYQLVLAALALTNIFSVDFFDDVVQNDISRALADNQKGTAKRLFQEFAFLKIGLCLLLASALFLGADLVAKMYDTSIGSYIRIASFLVVIRAVRSVGQIFLASIVSLRAQGAGVIEEISKLSLISAFFFFSALSVEKVLAATIVGASVTLAYVFIPFLREYRAVLGGHKAVYGFLFKGVVKSYGMWILLRSAIKKVYTPIKPWLIVTFLNAEAVALYTFAANMVTMVKEYFPTASSSLLAWEVQNTSRLKYIFNRGIKYSILYGLLLAGASFLFVPLVVSVLFPKYLPAIPLFLIFVISIPFHGIQTLEAALLTAFREQKMLTARLFMEVVIGSVSFIVLVPFVGILAAAISSVVAIIWRTWFLYIQLIRKYPELRPDVKIIFRFDGEDRLILKRAFTEAKTFFLRR